LLREKKKAKGGGGQAKKKPPIKKKKKKQKKMEWKLIQPLIKKEWESGGGILERKRWFGTEKLHR